MTTSISEHFSEVRFGTSGLRALVCDLSAQAVHAYVTAFLAGVPQKSTIYIAHDLRPSSPEICLNVVKSITLAGMTPVFLSAIPTPALALTAMRNSAPAIMITGSHIPFDRNGIKFYHAQGEISKADEFEIANFPIDRIDFKGFSSLEINLPTPSNAVLQPYFDRGQKAFPNLNLSGKRIGIYQHSAVGRDFLVQFFESLGAEIIPLGRSNDFVPIDTEAVSKDDLTAVKTWSEAHNLDAIFSTDGDGDRPWICDEKGQFVRGDILGIITARELGATAIATPVNSNASLEACNEFSAILRTKIGSPFVIEAMETLTKTHQKIVGYEANGGFLLGAGFDLAPLPTRDSLLPMLAMLNASARLNKPISEVIADISTRFTHSDRIQNVPRDESLALINTLENDPHGNFFAGILEGAPVEINKTDGLRMHFPNGEIVQLRPSGNAPELRCYAESNSPARAEEIVRLTLERIAKRA